MVINLPSGPLQLGKTLGFCDGLIDRRRGMALGLAMVFVVSLLG